MHLVFLLHVTRINWINIVCLKTYKTDCPSLFFNWQCRVQPMSVGVLMRGGPNIRGSAEACPVLRKGRPSCMGSGSIIPEYSFWNWNVGRRIKTSKVPGIETRTVLFGGKGSWVGEGWEVNWTTVRFVDLLNFGGVFRLHLSSGLRAWNYVREYLSVIINCNQEEWEY